MGTMRLRLLLEACANPSLHAPGQQALATHGVKSCGSDRSAHRPSKHHIRESRRRSPLGRSLGPSFFLGSAIELIFRLLLQRCSSDQGGPQQSSLLASHLPQWLPAWSRSVHQCEISARHHGSHRIVHILESRGAHYAVVELGVFTVVNIHVPLQVLQHLKLNFHARRTGVCAQSLHDMRCTHEIVFPEFLGQHNGIDPQCPPS
mmetsp:Transcript_41695/g.99978  ORF Transcript_41695/g.99978 Transcript_41695/m.99978 type:complete len:204 (+) Transcript_41695:837-1448(+)